jgi:hypothetical protein
MRIRMPVSTYVVGVLLVSALAACQGNIGSGSGLSIPQAAAPYQPGGPGQTTTSRERSLDGAVYLSSYSPAPTLPLPTIGGFGIVIALGTPGPSPSPSPVPSSSASGSAAVKKLPKRSPTSAVAHRFELALAAPSASPAVTASDTPAAAATATSGAASAAPAGSAAPAAVTHLSDASPGPSGSPGPAGSGAPVATASASPAGHHHTHPAINSGPKVVTKIVAYPDDAPVAPTPEPTGSVQTYPVRTALVRGYLLPAVDVPIYGLGAIKFTVPKSEITASRGYTIAVFTYAKKHRGKLLEYDTSPTVGTDSIVSPFADDPIVFKKNIAYELVLYADPGLATPVPLPTGSYPNAGVNPVPYPSGYTPQPGQSGGTPIPPGYPTPYATQSYFH